MYQCSLVFCMLIYEEVRCLYLFVKSSALFFYYQIKNFRTDTSSTSYIATERTWCVAESKLKNIIHWCIFFIRSTNKIWTVQIYVPFPPRWLTMKNKRVGIRKLHFLTWLPSKFVFCWPQHVSSKSNKK